MNSTFAHIHFCAAFARRAFVPMSQDLLGVRDVRTEEVHVDIISVREDGSFGVFRAEIPECADLPEAVKNHAERITLSNSLHAVYFLDLAIGGVGQIYNWLRIPRAKSVFQPA